MNTLAITASTSGAGAPAFTASLRRIVQKNGILFSTIKPFSPLPRGLRFSHHVVNESTTTGLSPDPISERSEADKIVDGMDFGQLCNEFECISSPLVESTARQLVRDILELRQRDRSLGIYAVFVKYKDPIRSFTGREKYERPLWEADALENSSVAVQEMLMLSTSVLNIKWTIRGKPSSLLASIGGDLIVKVNSRKDVVDSAKNLSSRLSTPKENLEIYRDLPGDPTKFFQRDDSFQRELYQIALFLAVVYFVFQFLRRTL
ncbi:hypothetical protein Nepgr_001780 [Nepenthes gracilis]|uniref:Uncharacterized protein n=1 Tax=Nepenthes gracilis TaxID=150966 RepID=A0AAD3P5M0_NEPGR|nr:hypothetical protein Nepgr_001780 [Nepenthes gracilis]